MSFFTVRERMDRGFQRAFNFASDAEFILNVRRRKLLMNNQAARDKHKSERCFVLATGPSLGNLNNTLKEKLKAERLFFVNSLHKAPLVSDLTPEYYVLMDNHYWGSLSSEFGTIYEKYNSNPPTFITDLRAKRFVPVGSNALFLYAKHYPIDEVRVDMSRNISITMNVVGFSILSALYMGFSEIYLMGLDHSLFARPQNNHCYDEKLDTVDLPKFNLAFYLKYYHLTTEFHYLIAKSARKLGVKVVNLSEGSLLDAYPIRPISYAL